MINKEALEDTVGTLDMYILKCKQLQSELDAYKIALKYFVDNGGHGAKDIADNLLREVTHG